MPAALPVAGDTKLSDTYKCISREREFGEEITVVQCTKYNGSENVPNGIGPQRNKSLSLPRKMRKNIDMFEEDDI